jgi:hypothetical protein
VALQLSHCLQALCVLMVLPILELQSKSHCYRARLPSSRAPPWFSRGNGRLAFPRVDRRHTNSENNELNTMYMLWGISYWASRRGALDD